MKSDSTIEKPFLYLLVISLLLHIGVFALMLYLPEPKQPPMEPVFIDLQQMPELQAVKPEQIQEIKRQSDQQVRVQRETSPKTTDTIDSGTTPKVISPKSNDITPGSSIQSLLKPKSQVAREKNQPKLLPDASKLAKLEETYRRRFEKDIAKGSTRFLDSSDIRFTSFNQRLENAIYGEWVYPPEALKNGLEGITVVLITFSRKGQVLRVKFLESSGSTILDDEVFRTLNKIGPVGGFPKGFDDNENNFIAFFRYGSSRRSLR